MKKIIQSDNVGKTVVNTRRSFLKKTSAGAVIASLPAKAVWATNTNLMSGMVSGGQSGWESSQPMMLIGESHWRGLIQSGSIANENFKTAFGGGAIGVKWKSMTAEQKHGIARKRDLTFLDIFNFPDDFGGPGFVNCMMACMYLNALHSGNYGVHYPIARPHEVTSTPYNNIDDFASYMYNKGLDHQGQFGYELQAFIAQNS